MMDKFELQKLRDLPIEGVAERLGMQVTRHKALCPFHDDHHASLSFSVRRNTYRCFACGAHGGTIDLVMKRLNMGFRDACRWLGAPLQLPPIGGESESASQKASPIGGGWEGARYARFFEHPFLNDEARRFLFQERRLDARVVSWCRLTSWRDRQGVPWLQTPYYDRECRLVGIQNRNLVRGALPRFRFPYAASTTCLCSTACARATSCGSPRDAPTAGPCSLPATRPSPFRRPRCSRRRTRRNCQ